VGAKLEYEIGYYIWHLLSIYIQLSKYSAYTRRGGGGEKEEVCVRVGERVCEREHGGVGVWVWVCVRERTRKKEAHTHTQTERKRERARDLTG